MQISPENVHVLVDVITPIALVAVAWMGMLVRNSILSSKLDTQSKSAELKEELVSHTSEIRSDLRAHVASDEQQFSAIQKSLDRIENKVG